MVDLLLEEVTLVEQERVEQAEVEEMQVCAHDVDSLIMKGHALSIMVLRDYDGKGGCWRMIPCAMI